MKALVLRAAGTLPFSAGLFQAYERLKTLRLVRGPFSYALNGLWTRHNADFMRDPRFAHAFEVAETATAWRHPGPYRTYVNCWAAQHALNLEGDFVECGVWLGFTARAVVEYVRFGARDRTFHLVDSYEGLRQADLTREEIALGLDKKNETYHDLIEPARRVFAEFKNVTLVKGYVPEVLPQVRTNRVAYLHIDMNNALPEIAAIEHFWPLLTPGAVVVLDDYGFRKHIVQKRAFDEFAARRSVAILALPTGQGLLIKP